MQRRKIRKVNIDDATMYQSHKDEEQIEAGFARDIKFVKIERLVRVSDTKREVKTSSNIISVIAKREKGCTASMTQNMVTTL